LDDSSLKYFSRNECTVDSEFREEGNDINSDVDKTESCQEVDLSTFNEDVKFSFGTRIELLYCGKARFFPSVTFSNGTFDFDHDNGERETRPVIDVQYVPYFVQIDHTSKTK